MAVIGSIRKRGTLILVVIGVSMLAFLLGNQFFQGLFMKMPDNSVAKINGKNIDYAEYADRVEYHTNIWQSIYSDQTATEQDQKGFRDKAWYDMLNKYMLGAEMAKLGIVLTKEEVNDLQVGMTVDDNIKRIFSDPNTGFFDPNQVVKIIEQLQQDPSSLPEERQAGFISQRYYFISLLEDAKNRRLFEKYSSLVQKGFYVTSKEAERGFKEQNAKLTIRFIARPYMAIPDSTIEVTDSEVRKYYQEFGYKFRSRREREVTVALFSFNPSAADTASTLKLATDNIESFRTSPNDTIFVRNLSNNPIDPQYYRRKAMIAGLDTTLFDAPSGTIIGPIRDNKYFTVAKKLGDTIVSDSSRVYHILVNVNETRSDSVAKARIDSIQQVIKAGGNFFELAMQVSEDAGSVPDSGKIGWVAKGMQLVPEFIDSSLAGKTGEYKVARSAYGYHLIHIVERTPEVEKALVAQYSIEIVPGQETKDKAYAMASQFSQGADIKDKSFDAAAYFRKQSQAMGFNILENQTVKDDSENLGYLQSPKQIIQWVLQAKRGEISGAFQNGYNYVVSAVNTIKDYGIPPLKDIQPWVKREAIKHKKALQIIEEFNTALESNTSIDAAAAALKLQIIPASDITLEYCNIAGAGREPIVAGTAFGIAKGALSKPIEGERAVYVLVADADAPAPAMPNVDMYRKQQTESMAGKLMGGFFQALQTKAKLIDRRLKFE